MTRPSTRDTHYTLLVQKSGHCASCGGMTRTACWQCSQGRTDPTFLCEDDSCKRAHQADTEAHSK